MFIYEYSPLSNNAPRYIYCVYCLPDCVCRLLLGADPKGSGMGPNPDLFLDKFAFDEGFTLPKSAKLELCDDVVRLCGISLCMGCVENVSLPIFEPLSRLGGQFNCDDWTGLLPVVGHGLVFNCVKLLDPILISSRSIYT